MMFTLLIAGGASAGVGPFVEVVFLHKQSKTLIVTDAVICVPPTPPEVVRTANLLEAGSPLPGQPSLQPTCQYRWQNSDASPSRSTMAVGCVSPGHIAAAYSHLEKALCQADLPTCVCGYDSCLNSELL